MRPFNASHCLFLEPFRHSRLLFGQGAVSPMALRSVARVDQGRVGAVDAVGMAAQGAGGPCGLEDGEHANGAEEPTVVDASA